MPATIHQSHGSLPEDDLRALEQALGLTFPADYRDFLLTFNGGYPEPSGCHIYWTPDQICGEDWMTTSMSWFYSITDESDGNLVLDNQVTFAGRLPADTLAIASDAGGNQLLLAFGGPHSGKVLLWIKDCEANDGEMPGYSNVGVVADSFTDFIQNCLY